MLLPKKLINFLEKNKVSYDVLEHRTVYTAFDKAKTLKVKPNIVGKTLALKVDRELIVVLLTANKNIDKIKLKKIINLYRKKEKEKAVKKIDFASERLIKNRFKGVKLGAIPPFGNLFKIQTIVSRSLLNKPEIIISSGCYDKSIRMKGASLKKIIPNLMTGSFEKAKK